MLELLVRPARAALLALAALLLAAPAPNARAERTAPRELEELLVARRPGVEPHGLRDAFRALGTVELDENAPLRVHRLRVPRQTRAALQRALQRRGDVLFVEENRTFAPESLPDDPLFENQWHLPVIDADRAWDIPLVTQVVIAILDTGVKGTHEDLVNQLVPGTNTYDGGDTRDVYGHGTKVAGTAGAQLDNGLGVASVGGGGVRLMPIRVTGSDGLAFSSTIADGLVWAADHGARVANVSFQSVAASATIRAAAAYFVQQGGVVVAGAGNLGTEELIAETPWILSVSATEPDDDLAIFSSFGDYVDLAAPGVAIQTTRRNGGYTTGSGTSYSGPVVASVAALMLAVNPALTPAEVETLLETTADDLGAPGWDPDFGFGRVNAGEAAWAAWTVGPGADVQCADGLDNDGDGLVDHPDDPNCSSPFDANEAMACGLGFELALLLPPLAAWRRRRASAA